MNGEQILFDELFLSLLFDFYLTGREYKLVGLVCRQFHAKAKSSLLYWRARIVYGFPKGHFRDCIQVDPGKFKQGIEQEPIVQEMKSSKYIVYVPNLQMKYQIMDKLQRFEAHKIFSAEEIILYYFVAKSMDKSMKIGEDLWQRMCDMAHKWGVGSILTDMELVESAQIGNLNNKIQILNKLVDNNGNIVQTVMDLCM
eukprot:Phypoly_transcript_16338.p1 GENE.Phypoly_transcript_16338~~Phypoly_transcript_16338.p1  ORF type:complete len:198 (+),score=30.63 Phypoly_transcript_16338:67-660(+)